MILLGLGGNLPSRQFGPPQSTLEAALAALEKYDVRARGRSRWYRSRPVPDDGQPWYINGVAELETILPPDQLLARVLEGHVTLEEDLREGLRLELIREVASQPERQYAFRHPLVQEAICAKVKMPSE